MTTKASAAKPVTKRKQTPNYAAAQIIAQVSRKVKRMQYDSGINEIRGDILIAWLKDWDVRSNQRIGGRGRK